MRASSDSNESVDIALISGENIDRILDYIPRLSSIRPADIAKWDDPELRDDGVLVVSMHPEYHATVVELMQALYENHFVQSYDWGKWQPQAVGYYKEPRRLAKATLKTCVKLLTLHVRKDRFVSGHFGGMVQEGQILAILTRLAALRKSARKRRS